MGKKHILNTFLRHNVDNTENALIKIYTACDRDMELKVNYIERALGIRAYGTLRDNVYVGIGVWQVTVRDKYRYGKFMRFSSVDMLSMYKEVDWNRFMSTLVCLRDSQQIELL